MNNGDVLPPSDQDTVCRHRDEQCYDLHKQLLDSYEPLDEIEQLRRESLQSSPAKDELQHEIEELRKKILCHVLDNMIEGIVGDK